MFILARIQFYKPSRQITNIRQLKSLYVDLDFYLFNYNSNWIIGKLEYDYFGQSIPEPNIIIFSGQEMVLIWLKEPVPYKASPLWQAVQNHFLEQLKELGGDSRAVDASRVFRIAGSINSKNRIEVTGQYRHKERYVLRTLIKGEMIFMETYTTLKKITPSYDPWEAYLDMKEYGELTLSNIEFTTTTICNMRCEHCAVGYTLSPKDPEGLPLDLLLKRLDEVPTLRSLSITGGEPMLSIKSVENYVVPILKYAHERGIRTQINSNLTLDLKRYEKIIPYLDVLHISHNWGTVDDFVEAGFAMMKKKPPYKERAKYFERIIENSRALAEAGVIVSAETMLNKRTVPHLEKIHRQIVDEMKCQRHEVHPMYPSDFASNLETLSLDEIREAIHKLLDIRDESVWMLFGTLPFYACSDNEEDLALLKRLRESKNVTVRNDPDGRSRLNVNIFTGDIIVTDFGDVPPLGNIKKDTLLSAYEKWMQSPIAQQLNCHCPNVACLGPNLLVKNSYYRDLDFTKRKARI